MVWDAARITPKPWANIVELYRYLEERNADFRPLLRLVEHVAGKPYAASIAGATSGTALLVAQHAEADWTRDAVRIDVALSGEIRFTFPRTGAARPATFECDGAQVVRAFESFLDKVRWVVPPGP